MNDFLEAAGKEWDKIRSRPSLKSALSYIWDYYSLWIVGIAAGLITISYLAWHSLFMPKENWFYITFTNTFEEIGTGSRLWEDYLEFTGFDLKTKNVVFDNSSYFDYKKGAIGNSYYEAFVAHVEAGTLDAVTAEKDSLIALGSTGRLLDLNRPEAAEIKAKYGERFLYTEPYDKDYGVQEVPVGIDLSDSRLAREYGLYGEGGCALGVGAYSKNLEAVELFLDFILGEGQ
ncbi:MAG: hypothetical protein J6P05_07120 [Lachnospiraceae bacterium]|nr:hypothetical protein [Lachnospiraceae bacterium]